MSPVNVEKMPNMILCVSKCTSFHSSNWGYWKNTTLQNMEIRIRVKQIAFVMDPRNFMPQVFSFFTPNTHTKERALLFSCSFCCPFYKRLNLKPIEKNGLNSTSIKRKPSLTFWVLSMMLLEYFEFGEVPPKVSCFPLQGKSLILHQPS